MKIKNNNNPVPKDSKFESIMYWLQLGIDFESRRIHLDMEVDETMATIVLRALLKMSEVSNDPIEIYLSSFGGEVYSAMSIYDAIRECECDVTIYASGKIISSGFVIYLAGDKRYAAPHTTFMMHSVSISESGGKVKDLDIDVTEAKRINNMFLDILGQRTKMGRKYWYRTILSHDKYLNVQEATALGVVNSEEKNNVKKEVSKGKRKKVRQSKSSNGSSTLRKSRGTSKSTSRRRKKVRNG